MCDHEKSLKMRDDSSRNLWYMPWRLHHRLPFFSLRSNHILNYIFNWSVCTIWQLAVVYTRTMQGEKKIHKRRALTRFFFFLILHSGLSLCGWWCVSIFIGRMDTRPQNYFDSFFSSMVRGGRSNMNVQVYMVIQYSAFLGIFHRILLPVAFGTHVHGDEYA